MNEPEPMLTAEIDEAALKEPKRFSPPAISHRLWWQIVALVAISAVAVYAGSAFEEELNKFMPESRMIASTYNKRPSGLRALFDLASKVSGNVRVWELPYRQLPKSSGDMMVIISPTESLREYEVERILKWVAAGNDLVYFDDFTFEMARALLMKPGLRVKATVISKEEKPGYHDVGPNTQVGEMAHVQTLRLASSVRLSGNKDAQAIAGDKDGSLVLLIRHGKGKIWLGSANEFCSNRTIAKKEFWGNFQLAANWFSTVTGTIYFDERCHGYTGGTNVFAYLSRGPLGACAAQVLLILAIAVLSEIRRFGAARKVSRARKISNLEFINGLSNAYRRARANPAVLEILWRSFFNQLARSLAVSPHEPPDRLLEAWSQSRYAQSFNLQSLLSQYEDYISRREVSDADLKTMIASCDKINEFTQS